MHSPVGIPMFAGMRHVLGTVFVGVVAVLFSGCASGSSTDDHRVTKQAYIARADAICARVARADKHIPSDTPLSEVLRETFDMLSRGVSDLKALDRPAGHDRELDDWFHVLDQELAAFSRMQRASDTGDQAGLEQLFTSNDAVEREAPRAARRFGFHDCTH
jgi:hypothetical protein